MPAPNRLTYSGGSAPVTAALTYALKDTGARDEQTGKPFTAALLMELKCFPETWTTKLLTPTRSALVADGLKLRVLPDSTRSE
ncbi:MAG: hypothetical protein PF508_20390 [Spirochaeta sp.]|nr:hypothetical protein [Spirochaeta sp.]